MGLQTASLTSTNPFQRAKSVVGDIVEGNMAGVHLEECVRGFGIRRKWNVRGFKWEEERDKRGLLGF